MMSCLVSQMKSIPVPKRNQDVDMDVSQSGRSESSITSSFQVQNDNFYVLQVSIRVFAILVNLVQVRYRARCTGCCVMCIAVLSCSRSTREQCCPVPSRLVVLSVLDGPSKALCYLPVSVCKSK